MNVSLIDFVKTPSLRLLVLPVAMMGLSSCAGVVAGAGVMVGTAAVQEGGLSRAVSDARIQTEINELWFRHDVNMFSKLDLTINQGRVLITGVVQDPQHRVEAVRLAWQPAGVAQVINEIKVADSEGFIGFAKDTWVTGRIRTAIVLDRDVESINYSIDTVQGTVYLMGFAHDQAELNHAIEIARKVENVKRVVSYVKLAGTPEIKGGAQNAQSDFDGNAQAETDMGAGGVAAQPPAVAEGEPISWDAQSVY